LPLVSSLLTEGCKSDANMGATLKCVITTFMISFSSVVKTNYTFS